MEWLKKLIFLQMVFSPVKKNCKTSTGLQRTLCMKMRGLKRFLVELNIWWKNVVRLDSVMLNHVEEGLNLNSSPAADLRPRYGLSSIACLCCIVGAVYSRDAKTCFQNWNKVLLRLGGVALSMLISEALSNTWTSCFQNEVSFNEQVT